MDPIGDFAKRCIPLSEEEYCRRFPRPVLVHEAGTTELQAINPEELSRRTISRELGPRRRDPEAADHDSDTRVTPTSAPRQLYHVYELVPKRDASASVSIGASPDCDVVVDDQSISRTHAYIEFKGEKCFIWDNESTKGTQLNEDKLEPGQLTKINSGDRLCLGVIPLTFLKAPEFYRLVRALFID